MIVARHPTTKAALSLSHVDPNGASFTGQVYIKTSDSSIEQRRFLYWNTMMEHVYWITMMCVTGERGTARIIDRCGFSLKK